MTRAVLWVAQSGTIMCRMIVSGSVARRYCVVIIIEESCGTVTIDMCDAVTVYRGQCGTLGRVMLVSALSRVL